MPGSRIRYDRTGCKHPSDLRKFVGAIIWDRSSGYVFVHKKVLHHTMRRELDTLEGKNRRSFDQSLAASPALGKRWTREDFQQPPVDCAANLIGSTFLWNGCGGVVVETEAYAEFGDEACHTFVRTRARDFVRNEHAGTIYAYLNYGVHWLFNVLTRHESSNGFVLLRAIEPTSGIEEMRNRRGKDRLRDLCSGPGKLTQALAIGPSCHGGNIAGRGLPKQTGFYGRSSQIVLSDTRIGISKAADLPWRFLLKDSQFVSRKLSNQ